MAELTKEQIKEAMEEKAYWEHMITNALLHGEKVPNKEEHIRKYEGYYFRIRNCWCSKNRESDKEIMVYTNAKLVDEGFHIMITREREEGITHITYHHKYYNTRLGKAADYAYKNGKPRWAEYRITGVSLTKQEFDKVMELPVKEIKKMSDEQLRVYVGRQTYNLSEEVMAKFVRDGRIGNVHL